MAPMDAQTRYNYLRNDPDFMKARINPHHPMHEQVKQEFAAMCSAANGGM
jgi:serine/threonine-protein kinase RIO1